MFYRGIRLIVSSMFGVPDDSATFSLYVPVSEEGDEE